MSNRVDINNLLHEMRSLKSQTQAFQKPQGLQESIATESTGRVNQANQVPGFAEMMSQAVNSVNDVQQNAGQLANAYQQGDPSVDITDVMIASQKASVSFEAALQVRNKLVEAYRDIMNMPI
ncbi:flagellar hook-basal body complex protein FliE [Gilvimarinus agarilyticus]|uniref:flagellar hook-basal body complex protein FliE n=1 Tax=unclassified Gilvimarinus TaxID=2642066 RepID=UPI001C09A81A|nr:MULTISPECIES: flagellar hook-basal body complex protein FliE [unclassified Gilvimarinus]MBU2887239.1 flagellar hook-basal body complex protein FliE [Gilvimarinus agarilyticus]MDO6571898.1 flagellar hook-basal body complex protein FliE [Gilvimarinus sp. 2_MG-2023]MDO6745967.1 flagellar hook-basal body complex protein FliE [Gilvimarinus sp. 1_MG-2023]